MPTKPKPAQNERIGRRRRGLRRVRVGLTLVLAGILLFTLLFIAAVLTPVLADDDRAEGYLDAMRYGMLGTSLLQFAGRVFCLAVPPASRAREIIYAAVALEAVALGIGAAPLFVEIPEFLETLSFFASLAALVLFVLFLMRLAVYLKLNEPAQEAEDLLGWGVWLVAFYFLLAYVLPYIPILGWAIAVVLRVALLVMFVVMIVRYVQLLAWLRAEVA